MVHLLEVSKRHKFLCKARAWDTSKCRGVPWGRLPEIWGCGSLLDHLFVQSFNCKINGYQMVCGAHTVALQPVTGPQTTGALWHAG